MPQILPISRSNRPNLASVVSIDRYISASRHEMHGSGGARIETRQIRYDQSRVSARCALALCPARYCAERLEALACEYLLKKAWFAGS
jgi:hypothetical protein